MKAKDRLSLVMCANVTGKHRTPIISIGKSETPEVFRRFGKPNPKKFYYAAQDAAWMDRRLCQEWLDNVFVPHAESVRKGQKVLLLWDNCPGHQVDASAYSEWLRIELFPPNVTSVFQPMDQGIIVSVKRAFKRTMLLQVLDLMEDWDAVQRKRRWVHQGCAGLKEGAPAHIGDVAEILINIWENF